MARIGPDYDPGPNPFGVCIVCQDDGDEDGFLFLGSSFSYRLTTHYLTAAHCVVDVPGDQLVIARPGDPPPLPVRAVAVHPRADLALLVCDDRQGVTCFQPTLDPLELGEDLFVAGFPEDVWGPNEGRPIPRLLKGYCQRLMEHTSHMNFVYQAAEVNVPFQNGISGAPLFRRDRELNRVAGVVTESTMISTETNEIEETSGTGSSTRIVYRRVVEYGIALVLESETEWLDQRFAQNQPVNEGGG